MALELPEKWNDFTSDISGVTPPSTFTYPFCYDPHPLAIRAAEELQTQIIGPMKWTHNFGLDPDTTERGIGKMFGVLVVKAANGTLGYLAAYSGIINGLGDHPSFVPLLYNRFHTDDFFKKGSKVLDAYHEKIDAIALSPAYTSLKKDIAEAEAQAQVEIAQLRETNIAAKKMRKQKRHTAKSTLSDDAYTQLVQALNKESIGRKYQLKKTIEKWESQLQEMRNTLAPMDAELDRLKQARKAQSGRMQNELFAQYQFLNIAGETQSLRPIFEATPLKIPPAGAGDCAAPKLLQYAFQHQLQPICMAEFWWGVSSAADIRHHLQYYPACKGKCEPILGHMLKGMALDPNPLLKSYGGTAGLDIIYQDKDMVVINKPPELLSVPGKEISDSVFERFKEEFPSADGPIIVHRLDMSTSGIMVLAMHKEAHKKLQEQFIKRTVTKRYTALLDGFVAEDHGEIKLPLVVDYIHRPLQKVDYVHGKHAHTSFKVIRRTADSTLVHFFPITGRTHQLRVHAAHHEGLNTPIVGDDLYGQKNSRLHLHAGYLQITHPVTGKKLKFTRKASFE